MDVVKIAAGRRLAADGRGKRIREAAGLSQGDLARSLGVAPSTCSRWEACLRVPRGELAIRYARLLERLAVQTGEA